jgi:tetratricopeptide (TPR) repeat protein
VGRLPATSGQWVRQRVSGREPEEAERAALLALLMLDRALGDGSRLAPGDARGEALLAAAVRHLDRALSALTGSSQHERLRVQVREGLARALSARPWRHDVAAQEAARQHLEALLNEPVVEADPVVRQRVHHNLGVLYQNRASGSTAENTEQAVRHLEAALATFLEDDADERAVTLSQLGNAYHVRLRGDHVDNVERALAYYREALAVRSRERDPVPWGITQHNLGILYRLRPTGDHQDNVRHSVGALQEALAVRPRDEYPEYWAMTLRELGVSQLAMSGPDSVNDAVHSLTAALAVYTREDAPHEWSLIQFELAVAAHQIGDHAEAERILDGVLALDDLERDRPQLWARVALLAGRLRSRRAAERRDEALLRSAVELMRAGAERLLGGGDLSAGRAATVELGNLLLALRLFEPAASVYGAALRADAQRYAASLSLASRGREVRESQGVAARAALALVREGRLRLAVEVLERGRGRLLGEALARDRANLGELLDGDERDRAAARRYLAAARRVRDLEQEERQRTDTAGLDLAWTRPPASGPRASKTGSGPVADSPPDG